MNPYLADYTQLPYNTKMREVLSKLVIEPNEFDMSLVFNSGLVYHVQEQFEALFIKLRPSNVSELTDLISLAYFPSEWQEIYLNRRKEINKIYIVHDDLISILSCSKGLILYREQLTEIM